MMSSIIQYSKVYTVSKTYYLKDVSVPGQNHCTLYPMACGHIFFNNQDTIKFYQRMDVPHSVWYHMYVELGSGILYNFLYIENTRT